MKYEVAELRRTLRMQAAHNQYLRKLVVRWRARALSNTDVYVASYPKSGSTWLRFLMAEALGASPQMRTIPDLVPPLGWHDTTAALRLPNGGRLVKVHEHAQMLWSTPPARAVVLVRDGRDVAVSYFYHELRAGRDPGRFPDFLERLLEGRVDAYGTWAAHVQSWVTWPRDLLVIRYEDLLSDGPEQLQRLGDFLGIAMTLADARTIYSSCSPGRMRQAESSSGTVASASGRRLGPTVGAVRHASAGQWEDLFDADCRAKFAKAAYAAMRDLRYA